jgi:hypothetical protein
MTTFGDLKTALAGILRDPDNVTEFDLDYLVNAGLVEVSRIAPVPFQEDITPVADTISYTVRSDYYDAVAQPELELVRVEVWDGSTVPPTRSFVVNSAASGYALDSEVGWTLWNGKLQLPGWVFRIIDGAEDRYYYRLWGYGPYATPTADADVVPLSAEAEQAVLTYARVEALEVLLNDRNMFTQWQARTGATDISPAGLMSELGGAREEWRRKSRSLYRLRAAI